MAPMLTAIISQGLLIGAFGAARSLPERAAAGECAAQPKLLAGSSFFLVESQIGDLPSLATVAAEGRVTAANLISVKYGPYFKVLTSQVAREQYVLTQCGAVAPSDADVDLIQGLSAGFQRKHFTIPLQQVVAQSTVQLSFLEALGVQDRVVRLTGWASGVCWQKALGCGAALEDQWSGNASILEGQLSNADVVFMDCSLGDGCGSVRSRANAVHFAAAEEPQPLHSAEHIKFMAAFFNKEREAVAAFTATLAGYAAASVAASPRPVVAWIQFTSWREPQLQLSQAAYKLRMVKDAGGDNVDFATVLARAGSTMDASMAVKLNSFNGSLAAASAAFFAALGEVEAVVDETYAPAPANYTMESFMKQLGLLANSSLRFVQRQRVLRVDGTLSENSGLDWFESRLAHPDWAVEGLARALFRDASKRKKYFRNIAAGETPDFILPGMCAVELPVCAPGTLPKPIAMPQEPLLPQSASNPAVVTTSPATTAAGSGKPSDAVRPALWSSAGILVLTLAAARAGL